MLNNDGSAVCRLTAVGQVRLLLQIYERYLLTVCCIWLNFICFSCYAVCMIFQLSCIFLITHLVNIKGAQALHIHPCNLHFLKSCLKKLCICLNGGKQQHGYSPDRVKSISSVHGQLTQPGFLKPKP